jgi:hypothetical protein
MASRRDPKTNGNLLDQEGIPPIDNEPHEGEVQSAENREEKI